VETCTDRLTNGDNVNDPIAVATTQLVGSSIRWKTPFGSAPHEVCVIATGNESARPGAARALKMANTAARLT
jgi:hypothetical protein